MYAGDLGPGPVKSLAEEAIGSSNGDIRSGCREQSDQVV
jgi:hypothetical protein